MTDVKINEVGNSKLVATHLEEYQLLLKPKWIALRGLQSLQSVRDFEISRFQNRFQDFTQDFWDFLKEILNFR